MKMPEYKKLPSPAFQKQKAITFGLPQATPKKKKPVPKKKSVPQMDGMDSLSNYSKKKK